MWKTLTRVMASCREQFEFVDPGVLIDGELELVAPAECWFDDMLLACQHPLTVRLAPPDGARSRDDLQQFIQSCPGGHQQPEVARGTVPAYHFWMRLRESNAAVPMAGGITLRVGHTVDLERHLGHIGYGVFPPARGHHYAERACRLLLPLAAYYGLNPLWITCNPDNIPSRRTCERLGMDLVDIVTLPSDHSLYLRGEKEKCRYRLDVVGTVVIGKL